jgi:ABC-type dipeptide/oligopeptide/nickel transport system permease subunit
MTSAGQASPVGQRAQSAVKKDRARRSAWRALRRNPIAMAALVGLVLLVSAVILAPLITPIPPNTHDYEHLLEPPSRAHPFGTDDLGRDIFSRVLWGGRESLRVAVMAMAVAISGGIVVGLISGYFGRWVDTLIMRIVDVLLAFPTILLLLSIVAALGPNLGTVLIALGISAVPGFSRLVRGSVLAAKNYEYVTAARVMGASDTYIMFTQILPNIMPPLIIYATVGLGSAILITAGLSYIGLGAQPPSPEWGAMLNAGRTHMRDAWWISVFPGLAIFLAVLFVNLLSDGLRDALDPKLRQ